MRDRPDMTAPRSYRHKDLEGTRTREANRLPKYPHRSLPLQAGRVIDSLNLAHGGANNTSVPTPSPTFILIIKLYMNRYGTQRKFPFERSHMTKS